MSQREKYQGKGIGQDLMNREKWLNRVDVVQQLLLGTESSRRELIAVQIAIHQF